MNQEKYIGMDVHQATISVAVMDSDVETLRARLDTGPCPREKRLNMRYSSLAGLPPLMITVEIRGFHVLTSDDMGKVKPSKRLRVQYLDFSERNSASRRRRFPAAAAAVSSGNVTTVKQLGELAHPDVAGSSTPRRIEHSPSLAMARILPPKQQAERLFQYQGAKGVRRTIRQLVSADLVLRP